MYIHIYISVYMCKYSYNMHAYNIMEYTNKLLYHLFICSTVTCVWKSTQIWEYDMGIIWPSDLEYISEVSTWESQASHQLPCLDVLVPRASRAVARRVTCLQVYLHSCCLCTDRNTKSKKHKEMWRCTCQISDHVGVLLYWWIRVSVNSCSHLILQSLILEMVKFAWPIPQQRVNRC